MDDSKLKTDWLVNNAVVAFVGALLLGQSFRSPDISREILWGIEPWRIPEWATVATISFLFILALFLALASVIKKIQPWAFKMNGTLDYVFHVLFLFAYTMGYLQAATELPYDQWWSYFLFFGGYTLMLFLIIRHAFHRSPD